MFVRHCESSTARVTIVVDGRASRVPAGASVAAALLVAGYAAFGRSPVTGRPRGPWCLMGTCFGCLVEVDGVPDVRACATPVREGMRIGLSLAGGPVADGGVVDPWGGGP